MFFIMVKMLSVSSWKLCISDTDVNSIKGQIENNESPIEIYMSQCKLAVIPNNDNFASSHNVTKWHPFPLQ